MTILLRDSLEIFRRSKNQFRKLKNKLMSIGTRKVDETILSYYYYYYYYYN